MNKDEYLAIKNNQKADNLPVLFYYAKLKGFTKTSDIKVFGSWFFLWIKSLMRHPADAYWLRKVVEKVDRELDVHFNVVNGS